MAEQSSVDSSATGLPDLTSDYNILPKDFVITSIESIPATDRSRIDDSNYLLCNAEKYGGIPPMTAISTPSEREEDVNLHPSPMGQGPVLASIQGHHVKPIFYEVTSVNEIGLLELDWKKLERKVASMTLKTELKKAETSEDDNLKVLLKVLNDDEMHSKSREKKSSKQAELEKSSITRGQEETFIAFKYERKNKLWDRKPHLVQIGRDFLQDKICLQDKFCEIEFTKAGLETFNKGVINHIELDFNHGVNILRRIAYPKLCEKHFSSEFPSGTLVEEDEPIENISISVDHFEFLHKEVPLDYSELFERDDFDSVAFELERDLQINNKVPSFIRFLKSSVGHKFSKNYFTFILAILKNPYHKIEIFYDDKLPLVNEQVVLAEYLTNCLLQNPIICEENEDAHEKLTEAIIRFANKHNSFLAEIVEGLNGIISKENGEFAYQIFCRILNIMITIGIPIIDVILPQHFEKISHLAVKDGNCDLYFYLLRACEISISNAIKHKLLIKIEPDDDEEEEDDDDDVDWGSLYTACYNYFGRDFTDRLIPVFKKYEKRKNREERYFIKKHVIYQTKDGYMNTTMRFWNNRKKYRAESEPSGLPKVKECPFNSAGKVLLDSSNEQLGYIIQKDMHELVTEDFDYWNSISEFPLSYLEDVTAKLKPGLFCAFEVC